MIGTCNFSPLMSVFMSNDAGLVGYLHFDDCFVFKNNALAPKAGFEPRVDGPVHKIHFLVRNLFQEFLAFFNINMAGTTCADPAAVVVEMDVVFFCHLQDGRVCRYVFYSHRGDGFIFESEFYCCHN